MRVVEAAQNRGDLREGEPRRAAADVLERGALDVDA